ncbi:unnamed protein product, partial [Mesorhabditis spiculigera]
MALVVPSLTLAGTRVRAFNQDDPRSIWMYVEEYYNTEMLQKVFNYYDLKPLNIRFITDKRSGKPAGYCFVDFATPADCIQAMLRVYGRDVPYTNPTKKFSVAFAKNPQIPEVDFVIYVNNLARDTNDGELFKLFLSRYPSCRSVHVRMAPGHRRASATVLFADYYEQQQAKEEFDGTSFGGYEMLITTTEPRIKLPRSLEGKKEADDYVEFVHNQVQQFKAIRRNADLERKLQARMAKQAEAEASQRAKIAFYGKPLPTVEEKPMFDNVLMNPLHTTEELNNFFVRCDNRLFEEIGKSRYLAGGILMDELMLKDELRDVYKVEESSDSDQTWTRSTQIHEQKGQAGTTPFLRHPLETYRLRMR